MSLRLLDKKFKPWRYSEEETKSEGRHCSLPNFSSDEILFFYHPQSKTNLYNKYTFMCEKHGDFIKNPKKHFEIEVMMVKLSK